MLGSDSTFHYTAGYVHSNNNFIIQNLPTGECAPEFLPGLSILWNIIQRGNPTLMSRFLESRIKMPEPQEARAAFPLISKSPQKWIHTIRGDDEGNYNPAKAFFEEKIEELLGEYAFAARLIVPEVPINWLTQTDAEDFAQKQVDFYLPQAFLAIEIDGSQHVSSTDAIRDRYLQERGIQTIRITTDEITNSDERLRAKAELVKSRIRKAMASQEDRKKNENGAIVLSDYQAAFQNGIDLDDPSYVATAVIRYQVLVLELLVRGLVKPAETWRFAVRDEGPKHALSLAFEDTMLWLEHIMKLQKISFKRPGIEIMIVADWESEHLQNGLIAVDFSLSKRYTDENVHSPEIIFVRTDYYDHYRRFRKSNSSELKFASLTPYDYRRIRSVAPIRYQLRLGGVHGDEESLLFIAANVFLRKIESPSFNEGQLPIIQSSLALCDTLGLLPTGGGKSLCFQLCAILQPCISLVVVPIKALMKDQLSEMTSIGIDCLGAISSDDDAESKGHTLAQFSKGRLQLFYVAPERFQSKAFRESLGVALGSSKACYAIIDEIHCLSEWGHDFRTSYLNLAKSIRKLIPEVTFIGLTATASLNVLKDIQLELGVLDEGIKTLLDYTRNELEFLILEMKKRSHDEVLELVNRLDDSYRILDPKEKDPNCLLIFTQAVNGKKGCQPLSTELSTKLGVEIGYFSGSLPANSGMSSDEFEKYRRQAQERFKSDSMRAMVATKAFGMGINKPNVAATIHYGMPSSMESFYQEGGRAGRDKRRFQASKAQCHLLFSPPSDETELEYIWDKQRTVKELREYAGRKGAQDDLSTGLFFLTNGLMESKAETELICLILETLPKEGGIRKLKGNDFPVSREEGRSADESDQGETATKAELEKAIYRLSQLDVIDDWTIEDYFNGGSIEVSIKPHDLRTMSEALERTMRKYDKSRPTDKESAFADERSCVAALLQWAHDYFFYNRKQSLKNIHDLCMEAIGGKIKADDIKRRLESYFKFSKSTFVLQHIAEHPTEHALWFEVLSSDAGLQSLQSSVGRFLESYRDNLGLNFISGTVRFLLADFDDADARPRLGAALRAISDFDRPIAGSILSQFAGLFSGQSARCRREVASIIRESIPWIDNRWLIDQLSDENSLATELRNYATRVKQIRERLYAGT